MRQSAPAKRVDRTGGTVLLLVVIMCLSKAMGFARDMVLSYFYGASIIADAYITTLSIPEVLMDILAQTVTLGFIPIAVGMIRDGDRKEVNTFSSSVMKLFSLIGLLFFGVLLAFSGRIITLLAPGFENEARAYAVNFLRIISVTVVLRTLANICYAYNNASKCFVPGAFMGLMLDVMVIAAIFTGFYTKIPYFLPLGAVAGTLAQFLFQLPFAIRSGFRFRIGAPLFDENIKKLLIMIIPAAMATGVLQITAAVNRALASDVVGGVTMLNYSNKISYFAENILVASVATVLYTSLSEYYAAGRMDDFKTALRDAISKLSVYLVPAAVGLACLSYEIIGVLYGRGEFTEENVRRTALLMTLSVIGILGIGVQTLLTRALFSLKRVKTSIVVSVCLLVVFTGLSFGLSRLMGLEGIALATGISYIVGGIVYYVVINRVCGNIGVRDNAVTLVKTLLASALMGGAILLLKQFLPLSRIPLLVILFAVGVVVYFGAAYLLRIREASIGDLLRSIKKH